MQTFFRNVFAALALAACAMSPLSAGTITYDDYALWSDSVTDLYSQNFTSGQNRSYGTSTGLLYPELQIVGSLGGTAYSLDKILPTSTTQFYDWNSGTIVRSGDKTASNNLSIRVNFRAAGVPTTVNAFGLDLGIGGFNGVTGALTVTPEGMSPIAMTTENKPALAFFGITSDTGTFSYVDISLNELNRYIVLDNVGYGAYQAASTPGSEVPDAAALLYVATGLGCILFARHRRAIAVRA